MIILDTIHEVIQKTLLEKMRMAGKSKTKISEIFHRKLMF